jgi:hypothetical protein
MRHLAHDIARAESLDVPFWLKPNPLASRLSASVNSVIAKTGPASRAAIYSAIARKTIIGKERPSSPLGKGEL